MTMLDDSHSTDLGLVADVRLGRSEAFGELYRRYYSGALRYALSMTRGDEPRAQDIVSEAFTRVFRAMSRNSQVAAFWPYLLASVRNAHRAELRRSGRVDLVERAADLDVLLAEAPNKAGAGQDDPSVHAAFRRLPPRWQSVLWRSEVCGDTASEIGHDLGISPNAAAALAARAREGLRVEYLRDHLTFARPSCRQYADHLAKLVRGVLGRRDRRRVEAHVRGCKECARALADLTVLNGKMRSVLPLVLGIGPFVSAQGLGSAPAGSVGSGLIGSATVTSGSAGAAGSTGAACVAGSTGAAGTAGAAGTVGAAGSAGAAGLAGSASGAAAGLVGIGSAGAVGITHATAVAGLAVASVVAVFGAPMVEISIGEPAPAAPDANSVAPEVPEPAVDNTEPASLTEQAGVTPVEAEIVEAPTSDATLGSELGEVSDASAAVSPESVEVTPTSAPTTAVETPAPLVVSSAEPSTTDGAQSAPPDPQPFSTGHPGGEYVDGAENWPGSDDGASGPGKSDAVPGESESAGGGQPDTRPSPPSKPSQAADPGTTGPGNSARPAHAGGGRHKKM